MVTDTSGSMFANDVKPGPPDRGQGGRPRAGRQAAARLPARARRLRHRGRAAGGADDRQGARARRPRRAGVRAARRRWATASRSGSRPRGRRWPTSSACRSGCRPRSCCCPTAPTRPATRIRSRSPSAPAGCGSRSTRSRSGPSRGSSSTRARTAPTGASRCRPTPTTLQEIARETRGRFYEAADAQRLTEIYRGLGTRLATKQEKQEVTAAFAGGALALLVFGMVAAMARGGRLP